MDITIPTQKYPSVGKCIYCGSADNLSTEHIIPFGLWGRLELPNASCEKCREITQKFETQVQQQFLGGFRARTKVPLRKGKKRNYKLQISVVASTGQLITHDLTHQEFPRILALPKYRLPQIFSGPVPEQHEMWLRGVKKDSEYLTKKYGDSSLVVGQYDARLFCRMLAKIAYGFAVAAIPEETMQTFTQFLPEFIRLGNAYHFQFVGGDSKVFPPTDLINEIDICSATKVNRELMFARIRLFACLDAPRYYVVIGDRPLTANTLAPNPVQL